MDIGEKISRYRKQRGMTQKQLADMLFVSEDLVSKWECGSRRPDYGMIKAIADAREKYGLPEVEHGAFTSFPDGK